MKIIYLHQYFNTPAMKGGTRSYEMAKRMVQAGHEVHIITSRREAVAGAEWEHEVTAGINVHWLPVEYSNKMSYTARIAAFLKFARRAGPKAVSIGGDIVFATSTPLTICLPAIYAKKQLKVPMVFEVRDLWPELPIAIGALRSPLTKFMAKRLELYAYKHSAHVVALSPGMAEGVAKTAYPREKISVIPNSSDLREFAVDDTEGDTFRAERKWLQNCPLVTYAGTLGHINGVAWMAEVAAEMVKINPQVRFLVLGEGVEEEKITKRAEMLGVLNRNFFMEKHLPKKNMPSALNASEICVSSFIPLPEMEANSANKFFDALAAGRPVAINYGGWQEKLVHEQEIGLTLKYSDYKLAAVELDKLLSDSASLKKFGQNSRKLAENEFSRDRLAKQLIEVLEHEASF